MWRRLVALVLAGCGSTPAPAPVRTGVAVPPPTQPIAEVTAPYVPPAAVAPPPFHFECHAFDATTDRKVGGSRIYDFSTMDLVPVHRGPRTADRPRIGVGRLTRDLRAVFAERSGEIINCWKFASSRGARATTLEVGLTIDPLGGASDLRVTSSRAQDDALIGCVTQSLTGATFPGTTTRPTRLGAKLSFTLADQAPWTRLWPRVVHAKRIDRRAGTACTPVLDGAAATEVRLSAPLVVTDFDPSRIPPPPPGTRRTVLPEIRVGCEVATIEADKAAVRTAVRSNYAAFEGCYADAFARDPSLTGEIKLATSFSRGGGAASPRFTGGPGDAPFRACLVSAMQDLWITPGPQHDGGLEINLTFALQPPPAPGAPTDPASLLAANNAEGALAAWTAILNQPHARIAGCSAHAGIVNAIAVLAPWLADPRMRVAIRELADAASALPPAAAKACVADSAPVIANLTRIRGRDHSSWRLTQEWLERYEIALPLAPYLDDGAALAWFYADALQLTPRAAEGVELLHKLTWDPTIGGAVTEELATRATKIEQIFDGCPD